MNRSAANTSRLRICLLSYRSNPHGGGQGIYIKNLARELRDLGHKVTLVVGPPGPEQIPGIMQHRLFGLDLYNPADPFRTPSLKELVDPVNLLEWLGVIFGGFPEPFTFGIRAYKVIINRRNQFDIIHDNQGLSYGINAIGDHIPLVATIHHPISVDRFIAVKSTSSLVKKIQQLRWHSFLYMQKQVTRSIPNLITVSKRARDDIAHQYRLNRHCFTVIPNGVNTALFKPMKTIGREPNRIITINSADVPLKGLGYLLRAVAQLKPKRKLDLTVVGTSKRNGTIRRLISELDIGEQVTFTGRIDDDDFVREYARASVAVIPSVYEGFGLPAAEAMACGLPVISTTGGALPEVVGDTGILVPPADHEALSRALNDLMGDPLQMAHLGKAGLERAREHFSWRNTAEQTVEVYRKAIDDYLRS